MLKTSFVPGSSAQTKAGYVLKYKGENHLSIYYSASVEDCVSFLILRWPVLQRLGGGVAGVVGGRPVGLVHRPARGRDQGRGQARGQVRPADQSEKLILTIDQSQPRPDRCGSAHRQSPGPAQSAPGGHHQPGEHSRHNVVTVIIWFVYRCLRWEGGQRMMFSGLRRNRRKKLRTGWPRLSRLCHRHRNTNSNNSKFLLEDIPNPRGRRIHSSPEVQLSTEVGLHPEVLSMSP